MQNAPEKDVYSEEEYQESLEVMEKFYGDDLSDPGLDVEGERELREMYFNGALQAAGLLAPEDFLVE